MLSMLVFSKQGWGNCLPIPLFIIEMIGAGMGRRIPSLSWSSVTFQFIGSSKAYQLDCQGQLVRIFFECAMDICHLSNYA